MSATFRGVLRGESFSIKTKSLYEKSLLFLTIRWIIEILHLCEGSGLRLRK